MSGEAKQPLTLGIDIGGTGLKAALVDADGAMVGERVRIDTPYPCPPQVMVEALLGLVAPLPAPRGSRSASPAWSARARS